MQPLAAVVAPGKEDHIQQFITDSPWSTGPLETLLAQRAEEMLGGKEAVLIIRPPAKVTPPWQRCGYTPPQ